MPKAQTFLACAFLFLFNCTVRSAETAPSCCGLPFVLTGDIHHFKPPSELKVSGGDNPEIFAEEVYGKSFTATASGLDPGLYTIEIDFAETYAKGEGQRIMDITCGESVLANDLDIFKAAGGFARAYRLTAKVEQLGDAQRGPLALVFTGKKENAKFNAIFVKAANGNIVASLMAKDSADTNSTAARAIPEVLEPAIYNNPDQPFDKRVDDLIRRMSLKEKVGQLVNTAEATPRLGVPGYDYWNECLHGVARNGIATVFPQATAMAAMWDAPLMHEIAGTISTEARAKYAVVGYGNSHKRYEGLTFWTPNINIFRDPRWGRGQETYGEDPVLTAQLGVAFITGLQGDDPKYLKVAACAKHFAVHSGPEAVRRGFNSTPPPRDLYETYLPQFEAAVREAKVAIVMGAYNRLDGIPCTANSFLLTDLL